mmetsp:Transcript_4572/g.13154  ORF Transcript_4572/g.13154 Transcript_4572/m.13154 type:complete len:117 (+) Transcript_4572:425-775(+)
MGAVDEVTAAAAAEAEVTGPSDPAAAVRVPGGDDTEAQVAAPGDDTTPSTGAETGARGTTRRQDTVRRGAESRAGGRTRRPSGGTITPRLMSRPGEPRLLPHWKGLQRWELSTGQW